jgi:hypothetical protein
LHSTPLHRSRSRAYLPVKLWPLLPGRLLFRTSQPVLERFVLYPSESPWLLVTNNIFAPCRDPSIDASSFKRYSKRPAVADSLLIARLFPRLNHIGSWRMGITK